MIANPEWFSPRRFGWGLGIRKIEGAAYIAIVAGLAAGSYYLPVDLSIKAIISTAIIGIAAIDFLDTMAKVYSKIDERQQKHELVAERNASFVAIAAIIAYGAYLGYTLPEAEYSSRFLPLAGIMVAMALAKGATLLYMEKER
ncbi:MAG: hypothetical protein WC408_03290 [Candidatus Micrarchaeia archaeon]